MTMRDLPPHRMLHRSARVENWRDLKPGVRVEWDWMLTQGEYLRTGRGTIIAAAEQPGGIAVKHDDCEQISTPWWLDNLRIVTPTGK